MLKRCLVNDSFNELMRNAIKCPLLPRLDAEEPQVKQEWDMNLLEEKNSKELCVNFSNNRLERAMELFAGVVELG